MLGMMKLFAGKPAECSMLAPRPQRKHCPGIIIIIIIIVVVISLLFLLVLVLLLLLLGRPLQKAPGPVFSNRIGVKFGRIPDPLSSKYASTDGVGFLI